MTESVAVEDGDEPVKQGDEAAQDPDEDAADEIAFGRLVSLCDGACLAQHVDDGNDQAAQTDAAKGVGCCTPEGPAGRALGHSTGRLAPEVPRPIDTCDGRVYGVLDPLADPVHGKGHVHDQPDDLGSTTPTVLA